MLTIDSAISKFFRGQKKRLLRCIGNKTLYPLLKCILSSYCMNKPLSFLNLSFRRALDSLPDSFIRARVRIIFTIVIFALIKALVVLAYTANTQPRQLQRAVFAVVMYGLLMKIMLWRPEKFKAMAHGLLNLGLVLVWTNIFFYIHTVNLVTVQFVFMILLSGFYTLGLRWGMFYSMVACLPVVASMIFQRTPAASFQNAEELLSPAYEILVTLNFISIAVSHYLFYKAFNDNAREKEALNAQLQLSIAEANKLAASKSDFLSTMSHELRTPLNSVIGIADLLLADNPQERQKENLHILRYSSLDLLALINNILDYNKMETSKQQMERIPFAFAEFLESRCAGLRLRAIDKSLDFNLQIDERLAHVSLESDPTKLSQLIYNLVGNAIKFTEKGSITVSANCTAQTAHSVDIMFSVADTGIGIHPDKHHLIFESFTQAESHIERQYGGTGLGLAIVKQIVTLFGSSIYLHSKPGEGTKFYFTISFPLAQHRPEETRQAVTIAEEPGNYGSLKILIAEDNELNRLIMKKQMATLNLAPTIVSNGQEAYEAHLSGDYDVIFMDLHMPVADGYLATKMIRAHADPVKAKARIVAFTATVNEQEQITEAGFDDFLYKPVNMTDLKDKLNKIAALRDTV